jgi:phage-related protein (TIGR01555 family)
MSKKTNSNISKSKEQILENGQALVNSLASIVSAGLVGNVGTSQLSQTATLHKNNRSSALTLERSTISYMYLTHGIVQTMIDQPVDDAFRGGIKIKAEKLDSEDIEKIQAYIKENNILKTIKDVAKWTRLFGGGALIINVPQKPEKPLNPLAISQDTQLAFYAADFWELNSQDDLRYGENKPYVKNGFHSDYYNFYGQKLHKSRVLGVKGKEAPSFIRPQLRGWGMSELERLVRSINQYLKNNDLLFELLDEAKVDIFKINGFNHSLVDSAGVERTQKRVQLANQQKKYQAALCMDTEDDYIQKQLSFSGIAEILNEIRKGIAADMKMPITKIFGISAAGFNSGEDDLENYNSMVESEIRGSFDHIIIQVVKLISQKLFGVIPENIEIEYHSLRVLRAEEEEIVKNHKLERLMRLYNSGIIKAPEVAQEVNLLNLIETDIEPDDLEDFPEPSPEVKQDQNLNGNSKVNLLSKININKKEK